MDKIRLFLVKIYDIFCHNSHKHLLVFLLQWFGFYIYFDLYSIFLYRYAEIESCQDSLASLARRIRVCFSRQIPVRIRAHPRGAFNAVGACTPTALQKIPRIWCRQDVTYTKSKGFFLFHRIFNNFSYGDSL